MAVTDRITTIGIEAQRLEVQHQLDAVKTQTERNKLGQFATPAILATDILEYAKTLTTSPQIRFLDPAFGTGAFYAALLRSFPLSRIAEARGYEIDPHYGREAIKLWGNTPLKLNVADFTLAVPPDSDNDKVNLLICNPPYVRHHHLPADEKTRLRVVVQKVTGIKLNGLAGLYCYFLLISHAWLADGGLAGWLIPSEFMDVNYGKQIKQYLLQQVTLLRLHRFDPDEVQFGDALVSSTVVWFKKEKPPAIYEVEFSYGGALTRPEVSAHIPVDVLSRTDKWTGFPKILNNNLDSEVKDKHLQLKLGDLFKIKRGLVTGANKFFILTPKQISQYELPVEFFIPILPGPRYLLTDEIKADDAGNPILNQQLFLLSCNLPENEVELKYPSLWKYLQSGIQKGINRRYLCRHRSPWYAQESRPASPFLCTYMGRRSFENSRPFRFILNHSQATAPNVYLMLYPKPVLEKELRDKPQLLKRVWQALNEIPPDTLMGEGRIYGGGLYKIEPNELANTPADSILAILPGVSGNHLKQLPLFE
ncbi:MAG: Eco57I restriction-modification methylase domain-containing protein [Anaerolineae bacterium]|nr:Eco57I restriction-modification methylase domain-containing protein [Anaerolineae bacterium]